jgi:hypothetical protein
MRWMVRIEVDMLDEAGEFSVDFCGQWRLFPDNNNNQKRNFTVWLWLIVKLVGELLYPLLPMKSGHKCVMAYCVESQEPIS